MKNQIFLLGLFAVVYLVCQDAALAKDFGSSFRSLKTEINDVLMIAAPLALMVAGGAFFVSSRLGSSLLTSSAIGVVVFAASGTIFQFLYRVFN